MTTEPEAPRVVSTSIAVWTAVIAGMLAIPLGLVGYTWLERANLARMGYTVNVDFHGIALTRSCVEATLTTRSGRRYVRPFAEALMVEIPTLQYDQRPERVRVIVRLTSANQLVIESAYYRARAVARRYNEVVPAAMSEMLDGIAAGCAAGGQGWAWSANCARGPGYSGTCPVPLQGSLMPAGTRLETYRD